MLITRQTTTGIVEQLSWLQALLTLASEARLPLAEASAALRSGERRTYFSVFTSEIDPMSNDEFEAQFNDDELAGIEFDSDDYDPALDEDYDIDIAA